MGEINTTKGVIICIKTHVYKEELFTPTKTLSYILSNYTFPLDGIKAMKKFVKVIRKGLEIKFFFCWVC